MEQGFNYMNILSMIKNGKNPQQLILNILQSQANSNPVYNNLMTLAKQNRTAEIERFARNLVESRGGDFDKEFRAFRQNLGL